VIQLLTVHVEQVRVALVLWNLGYHVQVLEFGDLLELLERLHVGELVEVARADDAGVGVVAEDFGDEALDG
jgi:hypothetical protein